MSKFAIQGGVPANYVLGRGRVYLSGERGKTNTIGELLSPTAQWRDIGNVTQMTVTFESETKDHLSYLTGIQTTDKSIAVSNKMNISFSTDEMSINNLAQFFGGTIISNSNGGLAFNAAKLASNNAVFATVENMWFEIPSTVQNHIYNMWFDLQMTFNSSMTAPYTSKTVRARDFESQANQAITVRKNPTSRTASDGTLLTEGTHYVLDRKNCMIKFLPAANFTAGGGDDVQIAWAAGTSGLAGVDTSLHLFGLLQHSGDTVALKFIGENANDDDLPCELLIWQIKLKPEGEFAGIGDEWAAVTFSGVSEATTGEVPVGASVYGMFTIRDSYST